MMIKDLYPPIYHARAVQEGQVLDGFLGEADDQSSIISILFDARESMQDWCIKPDANLS